MSKLTFELGLKSDPIEYRYSFPWLFELLAREDVRVLQLGSFFEIYQLPDEFFHALREQAAGYGIRIASLFTAHRELGGFFRSEPGFEKVARRNFERFIEVGGILGAESVGSNPGAVLRDQMATKAQGTTCYVKHFKELMHFAHEHHVSWLTIEPMSCLAEPPTLPDEMKHMGEELTAYHRQHAKNTAKVGYCVDIAHGYANEQQKIVWDHLQLVDASAPHLYELHLKNTDALYNSTFGFNDSERQKGIIDVASILTRVQSLSEQIPVQKLVAYLEIGGPKLGRDYSDCKLEQALKDSLRYLKPLIEAANKTGVTTVAAVSETESKLTVPKRASESVSTTPTRLATGPISVAPSMMCADPLDLQSAAEAMEAIGVPAFHIDLMDGRFAPNVSMSMPQIEQLAARSRVPLDIHLMVEDNDFFVNLVAPIKPWQITVHAESCRHLDRTLSLIRQRGIRAGVALNPHTSLDTIRYILPRLDYVLLMTVNPGFAGQQLTPCSLTKIRDLKAYLNAQRSDIPIAVDGNVSFANIPEMVAAGASYLVAGTSSLFARDGTLEQNVIRVNQAVANAKAN